jgi:hypothetical protein
MIKNTSSYTGMFQYVDAYFHTKNTPLNLKNIQYNGHYSRNTHRKTVVIMFRKFKKRNSFSPPLYRSYINVEVDENI